VLHILIFKLLDIKP